ncbi:MAG: hypothetical protein JWM11_8125, partial [Planctomycetaceae bacterium]|nr:hypothetical protein [Planctomycetaceae bacterium]
HVAHVEETSFNHIQRPVKNETFDRGGKY